MTLTRLAPAKVNLYLHVAAPDGRGYHPLQSLVVFADIGDEARLLPRRPGEGGALYIDGPFGEGLSAGEDNLIMKAVRRFEQVASLSVNRHDIALCKNLPIASGIGGGSADAGAVLHLLREAYAPEMGDDDLSMIAGHLGADGIMCLWAKASLAEGYGERLTSATVPAVSAVLINPLVECSTAAVYRGFDERADFRELSAARPIYGNIDSLIAALKASRNDLQPPAIRIQPIIADILQSLEAQSETLLARMSGSGATCFALCAGDIEAKALADRLGDLWPTAWVRACRLG